jgi:hypothetical protein
MMRLLPTQRMGSRGASGPRFWASSSARAGMLAVARARMAPAAAKLRLPVSGNMVRSLFKFRLLKTIPELDRNSSPSLGLTQCHLPHRSIFWCASSTASRRPSAPLECPIGTPITRVVSVCRNRWISTRRSGDDKARGSRSLSATPRPPSKPSRLDMPRQSFSPGLSPSNLPRAPRRAWRSIGRPSRSA